VDLPLDLTDDQQRIVDHEMGLARLRGGAGTGKTTTLAARYLRLLDDDRRGRMAVVCRTPRAADTVRALIVPQLRGGFSELTITTWPGLAGELVRAHLPARILGRVEQRALVVELLREAGATLWPSCASLLARDAFVDEVAAAVRWLQATEYDRDAVIERAERAGAGDRWRELLDFASRYRQALAGLEAVDTTGMLVQAAAVVGYGDAYDHVMVDDHETATPLVAVLAEGLFATATSVVVAANPGATFDTQDGGGPTHFDALTPAVDVQLAERFRHPQASTLVECSHSALEGETVAGELLAAHEEGVAWGAMAVISRARGARFDTVLRALARHDIPAAAPTAATPRPVVRALADLLHWATGDRDAFNRVVASPIAGFDAIELRRIRREAADQGIELEAHPSVNGLVELRERLAAMLPPLATPAGVAFAAWEQAVAPLLTAEVDGDSASVEGISAFIAALDDVYDREPGLGMTAALEEVERAGPRRAARRQHGQDAVTVITADEATSGAWDTVVVVGAVEGAFPRVRSHTRYFDRCLVDAGPVPSVAERRAQSLADERRLFCEVVATRATRRLVAVAAHQPGVLLSRLVEGWPTCGPELRTPPSTAPVLRSRSAHPPLVHPDRSLHLSASQLDVYEDCPLRYAYQYAIGVRSDGTVASELGTLVHDVLAQFLDPTATHSRDAVTLRALAERLWRDDIARFRPQVEEARRAYFEMLDGWWKAEGTSNPDVLAVELRFEIAIGPHIVVGQIDRIDRVPGGIRVVDYKTGKREPPAKEMPDNLQLAVYHLAATRDPAIAAWGEVAQLDLVFVRSMNVRSQDITPEHAARTEERILALADRILAEDFAPSPQASCRYCDFHRLCPLQPEGREVGAA
jgi:superfamily I DNA/RNA helicase/RecB family exonuclease